MLTKLKMKIGQIYKGLEQISKETHIKIEVIEDQFNLERHKLYYEAYHNSFIPDLNAADELAYKTIKMFFTKDVRTR